MTCDNCEPLQVVKKFKSLTSELSWKKAAAQYAVLEVESLNGTTSVQNFNFLQLSPSLWTNGNSLTDLKERKFQLVHKYALDGLTTKLLLVNGKVWCFGVCILIWNPMTLTVEETIYVNTYGCRGADVTTDGNVLVDAQRKGLLLINHEDHQVETISAGNFICHDVIALDKYVLVFWF